MANQSISWASYRLFLLVTYCEATEDEMDIINDFLDVFDWLDILDLVSSNFMQLASV